MERLLLTALLVVTVSGLGACAQSGSGTASAQETPTAKAAAAQPPAGSALARVNVGMNDGEVRNILGQPTRTTVYPNGKAWIPFYFGPMSLTDWIYSGKGRVVFSMNRYSQALTVIKVVYNPSDS